MSASHPLHHAAPSVPPDAELVARIRAGDEGGCEALYVAHHGPLWRFAYGYVRSAEIAEELVQEVFLALWRNRADWEVSGSVRAWLYGAVRNRALNPGDRAVGRPAVAPSYRAVRHARVPRRGAADALVSPRAPPRAITNGHPMEHAT